MGAYIAGEKIGGSGSYIIKKNTYKKNIYSTTKSLQYRGHTSGNPKINSYYYLGVKSGFDIYVADDINGTNITKLDSIDVSLISFENPRWIYSFYNTSNSTFNVYSVLLADYPNNFRGYSVINDTSGNCQFFIKMAIYGTLPNISGGGLIDNLGFSGFLKYNGKYMFFSGADDVFYKNFDFSNAGDETKYIDTLALEYSDGSLINSEIMSQLESGDTYTGYKPTMTNQNFIFCSFAGEYPGSTTTTIKDGGTDVTLNKLQISTGLDLDSNLINIKYYRATGKITKEVIESA